MSNVIAYSAYRRPEFLKYNLELLARSPEIKDHIVYFFLEHQFHPEIIDVIDDFASKGLCAGVRTKMRDKRLHPFLASHNILTSYIESSNITDDYVIFMEEDILPSKDYLKFHIECYNRWLKNDDTILSVIHKNRQIAQAGDSETVIQTNHFTSPVIISKKVIDMYIRPHICDKFFAEPHVYNAEQFPNFHLEPHVHLDHDGQLERIGDAHGLSYLMPDQGRDMHAGFYGGNEHYYGLKQRGKELTGTVDEKVATLKDLVKDIASMQDRMQEYKDQVVMIDLDGFSWDKLVLKDER